MNNPDWWTVFLGACLALNGLSIGMCVACPPEDRRSPPRHGRIAVIWGACVWIAACLIELMRLSCSSGG